MNTASRIFSLIFSLVIGLSITTYAATGSLTPGSLSLVNGASGDVSLVFDVGASALGNYRARLTWDDSILTVDSITAGTATEFGAPNQVNLTTPGEAIFLDVNTGSMSAPTGIINVATINLTALSIGQTDITLEIIDLADTNGNDITPSSITGASITVQPHYVWQLVSTTGPGVRWANMSYDESSEEVILFGGASISNGNAMQNTWQWNGAQWEQLFPSTIPHIRYGQGMTYDSTGNQVVMFGGTYPNQNYLNDLWIWNGYNWIDLTPVGIKPTPRTFFQITHDPVREKIVLFGGGNAVGRLGDTWEWDGAQWYNPTNTGPSARSVFGMSYDMINNNTVLYGGMDSSYVESTWLWDGNNWNLIPDETPGDLYAPSMAYDSHKDRIILYGGASNYPNFDMKSETWVWDGTQWELLTDNGPERYYAPMVYDSANDQLILYGGADDSGIWHDDTWIMSLSSDDPILTLQPTNLNVHRNQDVEITVNISDASDIVGYRIALDLDPSKVTYVPGSATKVGTSTENGWGPLVVNSASPEIAIFTCASATEALASGPGSLMKFQLHVNETLADFTPISVSFTPLTSLNEDAIAFSTEIWSATVLGPNHQPYFIGGANQVVLEDSGAHEIIGWATNISPGIAYESWQDLNFTLDIDNTSLFFVQPTIDASGTLRYTLASDEYGICNATAVLHDSGGTTNGGIDSSTPFVFSITVDPVNDAPSFIAGATAVVLNATGGQHTFPAWATDISTGPANESSQIVWFDVETSNPELFSASPTIDAGGTLRFTPNLNTHGVFDATATLFDSGGVANGGINYSPAQQFVIKIYIPFMWGDLNDNAQAGSVDASLLLQFNAELIDSFPGYPVLDYPEYYPDPLQPWLNFPIAADVNDDDVAGTLDASLVLQKYALLIDWFPADTDHDQWGPDEPLPAGKVSKRQTARNMNVLFEQQDSSWIVTFQIDNADDVQGLRVDLSYNPEQLQFNGAASGWLVPSGLLAVNDSEPGRLILSGALGTPLQQGQSNLMSVKFDLAGAQTEPLLIQVNEQQTQVNDGQIRINLNYPE